MGRMKLAASFQIATSFCFRFGVCIISSLAVGCASPQSVSSSALASAHCAGMATMTSAKLVEHRFDVRGYQETLNPALRHEAHAIYRRTRVPAVPSVDYTAEPRTTFPPASFVPLPASDELAVEIATQKAITAELRAMQASMIETERKVQAQYATLVRQSAETLKLREQLEAERSRVRSTPQAVVTSAPPSATGEKSPEVKW